MGPAGAQFLQPLLLHERNHELLVFRPEVLEPSYVVLLAEGRPARDVVVPLCLRGRERER